MKSLQTQLLLDLEEYRKRHTGVNVAQEFLHLSFSRKIESLEDRFWDNVYTVETIHLGKIIESLTDEEVKEWQKDIADCKANSSLQPEKSVETNKIQTNVHSLEMIIRETKEISRRFLENLSALILEKKH
jgi:hypothetical protein